MSITKVIVRLSTLAIFIFSASPSLAASEQEQTYEITEKVKHVGPDMTSEKFDTRARKLCRGDYEVAARTADERKVYSTIKCKRPLLASVPAQSSGPELTPAPELPKETFAKLRINVGMLPTCSEERVKGEHVYCGEKYSAGFATGADFGTLVKLSHYSLHKAASAPMIEGNATKWRKEEMFATSAMVSRQKNVLGLDVGMGLGYFGGILNQREWIEYPFPRSDETISKEKGYAWGLATEFYVERSFVETSLGDFNIGLSATALLPSSTSNPRVESSYWILPSLEFTWVLDLKRRVTSGSTGK